MSLKNFILNRIVKPKEIFRVRFLMNTFFEITLRHKDNAFGKKIISSLFGEIERIEKLLNPFDSNSELSLLNSFSPNRPVSVSKELFSLIKTAVYYSEITDGLFDITSFPLTLMWKKAEINKTIPSESEIEKAYYLRDWRGIVFGKNNSIYFKKPGMSVSLGALAKGYALDRCVKILSLTDVKSAVLNAGGQYYVYNSELKSKGDIIALESPFDERNILSCFTLKNESISVSGNYERFFETVNGKVGHIFPKKFDKSVSEISMAAVISKDSIEADALSTAIFASGSVTSAKNIADKLNIRCFLVDISGKMFSFNI